MRSPLFPLMCGSCKVAGHGWSRRQDQDLEFEPAWWQFRSFACELVATLNIYALGSLLHTSIRFETRTRRAA